MKASHVCFALTLLTIAINAMEESGLRPRGKPRQALRHSCKQLLRKYQHECNEEEAAISPRDESSHEEEPNQRALLTTAGFMHIDGEKVHHSIHSHTQTPSSSDDESIVISQVDSESDEYITIWCPNCNVLYVNQCPHHIAHSSSSSTSSSDNEYDYAESDGEYNYADSVLARGPRHTTLEEIEDQNIELFEIDPAERGRCKRLKIVYRWRTYAIREQSKNGISNKHAPRFVSFKRGKKLEKMFSE